eukprot:5047575-Ditylum_brightwellii.AAC.2
MVYYGQTRRVFYGESGYSSDKVASILSLSEVEKTYHVTHNSRDITIFRVVKDGKYLQKLCASQKQLSKTKCCTPRHKLKKHHPKKNINRTTHANSNKHCCIPLKLMIGRTGKMMSCFIFTKLPMPQDLVERVEEMAKVRNVEQVLIFEDRYRDEGRLHEDYDFNDEIMSPFRSRFKPTSSDS